MLRIYASNVCAVLSALASACIQGTVRAYREQSRIQQRPKGISKVGFPREISFSRYGPQGV